MEHEVCKPEHSSNFFYEQNEYQSQSVWSFDVELDSQTYITLILSQNTKVALGMGQFATLRYLETTCRRLRSQQDSETTLATSKYSASAQERDKVACRFEN